MNSFALELFMAWAGITNKDVGNFLYSTLADKQREGFERIAESLQPKISQAFDVYHNRGFVEGVTSVAESVFEHEYEAEFECPCAANGAIKIADEVDDLMRTSIQVAHELCGE